MNLSYLMQDEQDKPIADSREKKSMKKEFFLILLIGWFILITPSFSILNNLEEEHPNFKIESTPHVPIVINGNTEFAVKALEENWAGNGSQKNPYIIEEWTFTGNMSRELINISNTDLYFEIRNCTLIDGYIFFWLVENGQISLNELINTTLRVYHSEYINLTNNLVRNSNEYGIILERSNNIKIEENTIENNMGEGIRVYRSDNIVLNNNSIRENGKNGLHLEGSLNVSLIDNNILGNNGTGILMGEYTHGNPSTGTIIENTIVNNNNRKESNYK